MDPVRFGSLRGSLGLMAGVRRDRPWGAPLHRADLEDRLRAREHGEIRIRRAMWLIVQEIRRLRAWNGSMGCDRQAGLGNRDYIWGCDNGVVVNKGWRDEYGMGMGMMG